MKTFAKLHGSLEVQWQGQGKYILSHETTTYEKVQEPPKPEYEFPAHYGKTIKLSLLDVTFRQGNWEVQFVDRKRGYFENMRNGASGVLIFGGTQLVDYDGVFELPKSVAEILQELKFTFDEHMLPE